LQKCRPFFLPTRNNRRNKHSCTALGTKRHGSFRHDQDNDKEDVQMGFIDAEGSIATDCGIGYLTTGDGRINAKRADASRSKVGFLALDSDQEGVEKILALLLLPNPQAREMAELLNAVHEAPVESRMELAQKNGLLDKLQAIAVDGTTLVANLATIWTTIAPLVLKALTGQ
jgi:hypothetical protein